MRAAVYLGEGVDLPLFRLLVRELRSLSFCSPFSVNRDFFLEEGWEQKCEVVIIPGGRDIPYHARLKGEPNRRLKEFVVSGGGYLGICAGGYFGAGFVEFEKGGELEVVDHRELAFFPGKAVGPAYGKGVFSYDSQAGVRSAALSWKEGVSHVYFNGGCYFDQSDAHPHVEVIARYEDLEGSPPAIIECKVGKGRAILSGAHLECSAAEHERGRQKLWQHIIKKFIKT
ncbi:MAG: BPL-N domain-containing protein [Chlamydiales bacterium]